MTLRARFSQALASVRGFLPAGDSLSLLRSKGGRRAVIGFFAAYALVVIGLGIYWSWPPAAFDVVENRATYLQPNQSLVTGTATTSALLEVTRLLLEKKGGYISNDVAPPGAFLDNMPSWEYGALIQCDSLRDHSSCGLEK